MKHLLRIATIATLFTFAAAAPSEAAIIDFTDADVWEDADGQFSWAAVYDGVTVTVTAAFPGQQLTFNDEGIVFNIGCGILTSGQLACDGDGLGIGDDEVGFGYPAGEALFVHFSQPVDVTRFAVLDLYGAGGSDPNAEVAQWAAITTTNPFVPGSVTGTGPSFGLGLVVGDVNLTGVLSMIFLANGPLSPTNTDFAVAAIEMTPSVPEPATLLLTGAGLAMVARRARRRRA